MNNTCIVICNFNKKDYVTRAIESVRKDAGQEVDILVVDNASTDGSAKHLRENCQGIMLEELPVNTGGAGGFGYGMKKAYDLGYETIFLLDNDAAVVEGCIGKMTETLYEEENRGVVGPAICKAAKPEIIQELGAQLSLDNLGLHLNRGGQHYPHAQHSTESCDYVPACCLATKREVIKKIGVFDADFFLYWDDIDWCTRVRKAEYDVVCDSSVRCDHVGGGSNSQGTLHRYYFWRNMLFFYRKHGDMFDLVEVERKLSSGLTKSLFVQHTVGLTDLLPALRAGVSDAALGIKGQCRSAESFPNRSLSKLNLIIQSLPRGSYKIQLAESISRQLSDGIVFDRVCNFFALCDELYAHGYSFYFPDEQTARTVRYRMATAVKNVSIEQTSSEFSELIVSEHLIDILKEEPESNVGRFETDLYWNLLPTEISLDVVRKALADGDFCAKHIAASLRA